MKPTALEHAVFAEFHKTFGANGFPLPDAIDVVARENTGAGRYTELRCDAKTSLTEPCGPDVMIEMEGLLHGLGCVMFFEQGVPGTLELHLWGDDGWDGTERPWRIVPREASHHA